MENELLDIKEFAQRADVSFQAIYKRLKNENDELNNHLHIVNGKRMLSTTALVLFADKPVDRSTVLTPFQQELVDMLKAELSNKDAQIQMLQKALMEKDAAIEKLAARKWWQFWN